MTTALHHEEHNISINFCAILVVVIILKKVYITVKVVNVSLEGNCIIPKMLNIIVKVICSELWTIVSTRLQCQ